MAIGGALTGFAVAGPIGAAVGGAAGIFGGLYGESQSKKGARLALKRELEARAVLATQKWSDLKIPSMTRGEIEIERVVALMRS